jgi:hypothetical protein
MKYTLFLLFGICMSQLLLAQGYIDLTREKARKKLEKTKAHNSNMNILLQESDTTLSYLVRDSSVQNFDLLLFFDNNNRCYKEKKVLTCDSCYQKFLDNILSDKYYRWTKINNSTYYSRFPYRIILETRLAGEYTLELKRSDMPGNEYRKTVRLGL